MHSLRSTFLSAPLLLAGFLPAQGTITQLDYDDFQTLTSGQSMAVDDLESHPLGLLPPGPLALSNGLSYAAVGATIGGVGSDRNLTGAIQPTREFSGFDPRTTFFGVELPLVQAQDEYDIVVETVGGAVLFLDDEAGNQLREPALGVTAGFFGVQVEGDAILRVTFTAVGGSSGPGGSGAGIGNYSFDNIAVDLDPWVDLGGASVGPFVSPQLTGVGTALPGSSCELRLSAAPSMPALAVVAASSTPVPLFGGMLHAFPADATVLFTTDGAGELRVPLTWPQSSGTGTHTWLQFVVLDLAAPQLLVLSNGLRVDAP